MQSAVISYTLTVALLIPVSGWLTDSFGTRRIFVLAVMLFTVGSSLYALSYSLNRLVLSRILQGIGGAMMMPVARLTLLRAYPRSQLLPVLNFVTMPGLIGPVVEPMLGGWLVTYASWHWIFLINLPIGVIGILFAHRYMPNFTATRIPFDSWGFLLFSLSLVCVSSGMDLFGGSLWSVYLSFTLILSGMVLLFIYIRHAHRHDNPLINLKLFKAHTFSIGIVGNITSGLGTGCVPFLMPLMLQVGFNYPALMAGMIMVPVAIGSMIAKSTVTRILRLFGYRVTLIVVTLSIGLIIAQFALYSSPVSFWLLVLPLFMLGIFISTQFTSMNTLTLGSLSDEFTSMGNSVLAVTQSLSISFGVAVSAAVLRFYHANFAGGILDHFH